MASALYDKIGVLAIVLTLFLLIVIVALKNTFFAGWLPAIIVHAEPVFKSLKLGFKSAFRTFLKSYSSFLIFTVGAVILNVFALVFTAGVGLLITIPLTTLMLIIMGEVMYFESLGMRYYVDGEHIVSPKKFEERDKFAKVKDII